MIDSFNHLSRKVNGRCEKCFVNYGIHYWSRSFSLRNVWTQPIILLYVYSQCYACALHIILHYGIFLIYSCDKTCIIPMNVWKVTIFMFILDTIILQKYTRMFYGCHSNRQLVWNIYSIWQVTFIPIHTFGHF